MPLSLADRVLLLGLLGLLEGLLALFISPIGLIYWANWAL